MYPSPPLFCSRSVYNYFIEALEYVDTMDGLLQAAIAISMHGDPQASPQIMIEQMQSICDKVLEQCHSENPRALIAHLHDVMFDQMHYQGNADYDDDPASCYLSHVLQTQQGGPITLSLIYVITAHDLGLPVVGLNTPGYFLAAVEVDRDMLLVDPFHHGRILTDDQAIQIIQTVSGQSVSESTQDLFEPATHHQWIERLINHLMGHYRRMRQPRDLSAMRELKRLLVVN